MKKVLIVIMHLEIGGAEKSLVNFLNELSPGDFEIDLMLIKKRGALLKQVPEWINIIDAPRALKNIYSNYPDGFQGIPYTILRFLFSGISKILFTESDYAFKRWSKFYTKVIPQMTFSYDIAMSYLHGESMFFVAEKVKAKKKFAWIHTDLAVSERCNEEYKTILPYFDRIITISPQCLESIHKLYIPDKERLVYLPNIVSSKYIRAMAQEKAELQFDNEQFNIISLGRLDPVKGFDMAIEAAAIMRKRNVNFCWYIAGDGEERKNLELLIKQYHLENQFILLGMQENPYPYIAQSDLMVQTSRFEGKSIAVDEAKILGVPILVTNYATAKDQITPETGWIVGMSSEEIAEGIMAVIDHEGMYKKVKQYLQNGSYGNAEEIETYMKCFDLKQ